MPNCRAQIYAGLQRLVGEGQRGVQAKGGGKAVIALPLAVPGLPDEAGVLLDAGPRRLPGRPGR